MAALAYLKKDMEILHHEEMESEVTVSYTHLEVYKRQVQHFTSVPRAFCFGWWESSL